MKVINAKNIFKNSLIFLVVVFLFIAKPVWAGTCWNGGSSGSAPWTVLNGSGSSLSCAYADVKYCVNTAAAPGEIVNVTKTGSCDWSSQLIITKGINLIGPGAANLTVKNTTASATNAFIVYNPSNYTVDNAFRLSGFTFDANNQRILELGLTNMASWGTGAVMQTKTRVDNNVFTSSSGSGPAASAIRSFGSLYGVVDHNLFSGLKYPIKNDPSVGVDPWWNTSPQNIFVLGSPYYLYYEDNVFTGPVEMITDGQCSSRYVYRYNTVLSSGYSGTLQAFDLHGQQGNASTDMAANFGAELYGNKISSATAGIGLLYQRSGQTRVFFNRVDEPGNGLIQAYTSSYDVCPNYVPELKLTHNTYWWGNRNEAAGSYLSETVSGGMNCNGLTDIPTKGRDVITDSSNPGVGCGTTLPGTCVINQAYWLTADATMCTNLTNYVGAKGDIGGAAYTRTSDISGKLYKCTATNAWSKDGNGITYVPYNYPHPLTQTAETCNQYKRIDDKTLEACTCNQADVKAAIDNAADGNAVQIPAGNCTWSSYISISKSLSVIGSGSGTTETVINTNGNAGLKFATGKNNIRISAIRWIAASSGEPIVIGTISNSPTGNRDIRIDHCYFSNYGVPIRFAGHSTGVIDSNTFNGFANNGDGINIAGDNSDSWAQDTGLGGNDFIFFEDNICYTANTRPDQVISSFQGGRMVVRHNLFEETGTGSFGGVIDVHGNGHGDDVRSGRAWEFYDNTFKHKAGNWARAMHIRGGTGVIYNNTFDNTNSFIAWDVPIEFQYYRASSGCSGGAISTPVPGYCDPSATSGFKEGYPCTDQQGRGKDLSGTDPGPMTQAKEPILIWNNKFGSTYINNPIITNCTYNATAIQANRDYCASDTNKPSSCNNVTLAYNQYQYPHPLRNESTPTCAPADANSDGLINISDVQTCINVILGTDTIESHRTCSDVNGGGVNITDCQGIINKILNP